jgi:hypothetical protein
MCIETESDDETIDHCPHRQRIIAAAKLAKAEQERLEREYGLRDGRRPKRTPGGYFDNTKARADPQEPSS